MNYKIIFRRAMLAISLLSGTVVDLQSQDTHYWSTSYGTQAQLLGGLVVGSSTDLSSTYYNPGALALSKDSALILSTLSLGFSSLSIELGLPEPVSAESFAAGPAPTIFALRMPFSVGERNDLVFSYIGRRSVHTDLSGSSTSGTGGSSHISRSHFLPKFMNRGMGYHGPAGWVEEQASV